MYDSDAVDILDLQRSKPSTKVLVDRFKRYGTIVQTLTDGIEKAHVGKINDDDVFVVFYPNGEFDRFENKPVVYRDGWKLSETTAAVKAPTTKKTAAPVKPKVQPEVKADAKKRKSPTKKHPTVAAWFGLLGVDVDKPTKTTR